MHARVLGQRTQLAREAIAASVAQLSALLSIEEPPPALVKPHLLRGNPELQALADLEATADILARAVAAVVELRHGEAPKEDHHVEVEDQPAALTRPGRRPGRRAAA